MNKSNAKIKHFEVYFNPRRPYGGGGVQFIINPHIFSHRYADLHSHDIVNHRMDFTKKKTINKIVTPREIGRGALDPPCHKKLFYVNLLNI